METPERVKLNAQLFGALECGDKALEKQAIDAVNGFLRTKVREEPFWPTAFWLIWKGNSMPDKLSFTLRLKIWMRDHGFGRFRWFRRWCGGKWHCECSIRSAIENQVLQKNPLAYVTRDFRVISFTEDWPDRGMPYPDEAPATSH